MFLNEIYKIGLKSMGFLPPLSKPKIIKHIVELTILSLADFVGLAFLLPLLLLLLSTGAVYQSHIERFPIEYQYVFLLVVLVFFLIKSLAAFYLQKKQVRIVANIVRFVSANNTEQFLNMPYERRMETDTSLFSERVYFQPLYIGQGIFIPLFTLFQESVVLLFILAGMIVFYPYVSLGLITVLVVSGLITNKWIRKRSIGLGEKNIENRKKLFNSIGVNISGMLDIKQNNTQRKFKDSVSEKVRELAIGELESNTLRIIPFRANELISVIGLIFLILYAKLINPNADFITMGSIFALALFRSIPAINRIQLNLVQVRLYSNHLNTIHADNTSEAAEEMAPFEKEIELRDIHLMYSNTGTPILEDINFKIPKGTITFFSGKSGSGKSSLLRIIAGQMSCTKGDILIDGILLKENNLNSWQNQVALISQKPFVLKGGIVDNVVFGSEDKINIEKVREALCSVGLQDFVEEVENRRVGEDGYKISEGQKQRLMLARAIYKGTPLLLLDEITANLDTENTQIIMKTLRELCDKGHTIILSSHNQEVTNIADLYCNFRDRKIFINEHSKSDS